MNNPKPIPACVHFRKEGYNCIQHAKFTVIEQLTKMESISKATLKLRLKQREDFWLLKLGTFTSKGLNHELNKV